MEIEVDQASVAPKGYKFFFTSSGHSVQYFALESGQNQFITCYLVKLVVLRGILV
jgi:hypothetical protein